MNERRRLVLIGLAILMSVASVRPAYADFKAVVHAIESRYGVRQTWIPFFGLARLAIRVAHPEGVADLQLAVFEDAHFDDVRGVEALVRQYAGEGYRPLVQVHSTRSGECSLIYAMPAGRGQVALLIFAHDQQDTTLLNVVVSPERLEQAMSHPGRMTASLR
jgi:hypothetical protein